MKRLLTFVLSITLLLGSAPGVPVYAETPENQSEVTETAESEDTVETADTAAVTETAATEDTDMGADPVELQAEESALIEEPEETDEEEQDKLSGIDGYTLSGTVEAADLENNQSYTLTADTTIHIANGVNKKIYQIKNNDTECYNLTVTGDSGNLGTLTMTFLYHNEGKEGGIDKTLSITGGRLVSRRIYAGGDIIISGGIVEATQIETVNGTVSISGDSIVKVHEPDEFEDYGKKSTIHGKNVTISGGNVEILNENVGAGIFAENNLSISGGVVNVRSIKEPDTYYYEKGCGLFSMGTLQISDTAVILAEGFKSAVSAVHNPSISGITVTGMNMTDLTGGGTVSVSTSRDDYAGWCLVTSEGIVKNVYIESIGNPNSITTDKSGGIVFAEKKYGEAAPAAETVTVTNNGSGLVRLGSVVLPETTAFQVTELTETFLLPGDTAGFEIQPKELVPVGNHSESVTITTDRTGVSASFNVSYTVKESTSKIQATPSTADFGTYARAYDGSYEDAVGEKTVTITNSGEDQVTIDDTAALDNFVIMFPEDLVLNSGENLALHIAPKAGLAAGNYDTELYIKTTNHVQTGINVKLTVQNIDYTIETDKDALDFGYKNFGYLTAPEAQTITIKNASEKEVTLKDISTLSDKYDLSTSGSLKIDPGKTISVRIRPKTGIPLAAGNETITFETIQGSSVAVNCKFGVGHYLSGTWKASELASGALYYLVGDSRIDIDAGADKTIYGITNYNTGSYNLTITGSDAGRFTVTGNIITDYGEDEETKKSKKIVISGGNLTVKKVNGGGDLEITGGNITAEEIRSAGKIAVSGNSVLNVHKPDDPYAGKAAIEADTVLVSGGKTKVRNESKGAGIYAEHMTISGGFVEAHALNPDLTYAWSGCGLYSFGSLEISGNPFVLAKGTKEAVSSYSGNLQITGMSMFDPESLLEVHLETADGPNIGRLVDESDQIVKNVEIEKVAEASDHAYTVSPSVVDFGTMFRGAVIPEARTVLVSNTGTAPIRLGDITSANFEIGDLTDDFLFAGETASFTIRPKAGLAVDTYEDKIAVGILPGLWMSKTFTAKVIVTDPEYDVSVSSGLLDFGTVPAGYQVHGIMPQTVQITNTGNVPVELNELTVSTPILPFAVDGFSAGWLGVGESRTAVVTLKAGEVILADQTASVTFKTTAATGGFSKDVQLKVGVLDIGTDGIWIEDIPDQDYAGAAIKPEVNVYYGSRKLTDQDYSVSYKNNVNAAPFNAENANGVSIAPVVIVKGKGNYAGTASKTFTIKPLDIGLADAPDLLYAYNSKKAQYGKTKVTYDLGGKTVTLKENTDFTYEWGAGDYKTENTTYTTKIIGKGNYQGTTTFYETIAGSDQILISKVTVPKIPDQPYQGKKIILKGTPGTDETPAVDKKGDLYDFVIKNSKTPLNYGSDYTLSYAENLEIGTATVTITGNGDYVGSRTVTFGITGTALSKAKTEDFVSSMPYSGSARLQPMKFYFMKKNSEGINVKDYLTENVDYRADYTDNTEIGTATVTYTGIGAYTGTVKKTYKIIGTEMKDITIPKDFTATTGNFAYTDYMSADCYDEQSGAFLYTGGAFEVAGPANAGSEQPNNGVQLLRYDKTTDSNTYYKNGVDYIVTYKNNVLPGTATVTFTGKGRLTGSVSRTFKIVPYNISGNHGSRTTTATLTGGGSYKYTKGGVKPEPVVKCKCFNPIDNAWEDVILSDASYTLTYSKNTDEITGTTKPTVTVKGKGTFTGTVTPLEYTITTAKLASDAEMTVTDVVYRNKAGICKPTITVTDKTTGVGLKAGTDYEKTVKYTYKDDCDVAVKGKATTEHRDAGHEVGAKDIVPLNAEIIATVTGMKKYIGSDLAHPSTLSATFRFIDAAYDLSGLKITILPQTFTGEKITLTGEDIVFDTEGTAPEFGVDYEILYDDASGYTDKGSYKVTFKAKPGSPFGNSQTVSFSITARSMDYTIHYDGNQNTMAQKLLDKNVDPEKDLAWYQGNYRVTEMKDSVTTKGGKLPGNSIVVQKKTIRKGKETWTNVPSAVIAFDKWTTESDGGGTPFADQGIFSPSWLPIFTYGNEITLYAQWK